MGEQELCCIHHGGSAAFVESGACFSGVEDQHMRWRQSLHRPRCLVVLCPCLSPALGMGDIAPVLAMPPLADLSRWILPPLAAAPNEVH